ncbi:DoxX family protein [Sphingomonas sp. AOB5]|uniref:DoxX family protein n=1 Tax=Sphingomonas sp. AOB5 TaxID=3034017 RepID=UPI0023F8BBC6|nr:DoxX family protein [Sphingomonas sp. AOB5]MDF7775174.1 DoxX family protein [Sphingomonas sp. AOB5]
MSEPTTLLIPKMGNFYDRIAMPGAWVLLRLCVGGLLMVEGWPKIVDPLAMTGFVEGIGFWPGWFWSPLLAVLQFVGGFMIAIGLLTRPVALANAVMLAITLWFHMAHPYGDAFLTQAGIAALEADKAVLFTADAARPLADGGARFLALMQHKAEFLSAIWTLAVLLVAAAGGGPLSVDRSLLKREV